MRGRLGCAKILVFLTLTVWASRARAQAQESTPVRAATLVWDEKQMLRMTVSYRDIVDSATQVKLTGGLPTTIVMQAYAFRESGGDAIAGAFKSCRVTYDLWDEVYQIDISQSGAADSVAGSPTLEGVLWRCAEADRLAIVSRAAAESKGPIYVAVLVQVNPVSPQMLDRIRRWVSRSTGAGSAAPGDALFGSFVGLFVTKIGSAERQLAFRTQAVLP